VTALSVNVNKVALLRNSRGGNVPNVLQFAQDCVFFGAQGITVHPRPDGRHVRRDDVYELKSHLKVELNVEGYPSPEFLDMLCEVRPAQATLVPDPPGALTSDHGWNTISERSFLRDVVARLQEAGVRVSLFIDPDPAHATGAKDVDADRVELYTGPYAHDYPRGPEAAIAAYREAAREAERVGLGLNAGHDLNLDNLAYFRRQIPNLLEVSIGHALVADALYLGLERTIESYLACLQTP